MNRYLIIIVKISFDKLCKCVINLVFNTNILSINRLNVVIVKCQVLQPLISPVYIVARRSVTVGILVIRSARRSLNGFVNGGESDQSKSSCVLCPSRRAWIGSSAGGRFFFYFILVYYNIRHRRECTQLLVLDLWFYTYANRIVSELI